ncbi:hypothetical protein B0H13DRAFT_2277610 [Mycena leptocephala]|nr:hypothetical protein B0H13DRAFT_2277610 [Mycena leptocephala]
MERRSAKLRQPLELHRFFEGHLGKSQGIAGALEGYCVGRSGQPELPQRASQSAPKLEVLRLNCGRAEIILPPAIFAYETPCLRELELRGCAITKDSHLFRNLSYLSIDELPPDSTFTVLQWLGILKSPWTFDGIHFCASPEEKGDVVPGSEDSEFYLAFRNVLEPPTFTLTLAVLDALPTSDIAVLDLGTPVCCQCLPPSHGVFSPEDDWVSLLRRFPAVHTLQRIQFNWATAGLTLLTPALQCPDTGDVTTQTEVGVLPPALHTLGFVNTAFDIPAIIPSLMALLCARLDRGKPIKTMTMDFCKNVLHMFMDAKVDVQWDGHNRFEGEEELLSDSLPQARRPRKLLENQHPGQSSTKSVKWRKNAERWPDFAQQTTDGKCENTGQAEGERLVQSKFKMMRLEANSVIIVAVPQRRSGGAIVDMEWTRYIAVYSAFIQRGINDLGSTDQISQRHRGCAGSKVKMMPVPLPPRRPSDTCSPDLTPLTTFDGNSLGLSVDVLASKRRRKNINKTMGCSEGNDGRQIQGEFEADSLVNGCWVLGG